MHNRPRTPLTPLTALPFRRIWPAGNTTDVVDEQRRQGERSAHLCVSRPAAWSAMVRYTDEMVRTGVEMDEARRRALDLFAPATGRD